MLDYLSDTKIKIFAIIISIIIFFLGTTILNFRNRQENKDDADGGFTIGLLGIFLSIECVILIIYLFIKK